MRLRTAGTALLLAGLSASAVDAGDAVPAGPPLAEARIVAHRIEIRFEPATHSFVAKDTLELEPGAETEIRLELANDAKFLAVAEAGLELASKRAMVPTVVVPAGTKRISVEYSGRIFDAVQKRDDLSWVVGDSTRGLISDKGIYLTGTSGWYPRGRADTVARFDVVSFIPQPLLVITQGRPPERSIVLAPPGWTSVFEIGPPFEPGPAPSVRPGTPLGSPATGITYAKSISLGWIPTDECVLVAGPYVENTREVQGISVSTYFLESDAKDADLWLDAATEIVSRYEPILGTYPHKKFDIVENFFSTGYGMASFTLLGNDVIPYVTATARGAGNRIPPGYLDHEYVHGWFGNGLFVDSKDGNWCEALTTYFSNYLAKELESPAAGAEHRRGVLEKYAIRVTPETDYPVRSFQTKTEDKDNDVGYGKGSLIFHVLRKRLGDVEFFDRVRRMSAARVGTHVSWADWIKALDGDWALPFLERKGLPAIRLASATAWPIEGGKWAVRAEAVVDQPRGEEPWPAVDLDVDVDGRKNGTLRLDGRSGVWRGEFAFEPKSIELDARYDALRRIADADLPPCLERTLAAKNGDVVPVGSSDFIQAVAKKVAAQKKFEIVAEDAAPRAGRATFAVRVLREGETLKATADDGTAIEIAGETIRIGERTWTGSDHSVLVSFLSGGVPQTWFVAMSEKAAGRAKYLTYYGWDQFVVFQAGNRVPVARGFLDRTPKGTSRAVVKGDAAAARIAGDIEMLSSDEFGGRLPGTEGHRLAYVWLIDRLRAQTSGRNGPIPVQGMNVGIGVPDLASSRDLVLTTPAGIEVVKDAFRPLWPSPAHASGTPLPFAEGAGAVPLPGRLPDTSPEGLSRFWRQVESGTAPAVLVAPSAAARRGLAPFLDTPSVLAPESIAELDKPDRNGKVRERPSLPHWISGRRQRALPGAPALRVPVLVLEETAIARLERDPKPTAIDFSIDWTGSAQSGSNVFAWAGADERSSDRPSIVLVVAHYDSFGTVAGKTFRGADDNATGVACVLEAVRGLENALAGTGRHKVVVLFADGEEWGLMGSRSFAARFADHIDIRAVVNVDSVGRVRDDTVHVIGLSTHPELAKKAGEALTGVGLKVGPDIDKYAYEHGSDHWPFHEKGIPAITLWASDYGTMNTAADEPALVDPVGVARISAALRALLDRLTTE